MNIPGLTCRPRLTPNFPTEKAQLARINLCQHLLSDEGLVEIRADWDAGVAREIADAEIERRAGLSAHDRLREATGRRRHQCQPAD